MMADVKQTGTAKTKNNKDLAAQRDRQREMNPSRLDKIVDEPVIQSDGREVINSYDYYGENNAQRSDYASIQRNNQPAPNYKPDTRQRSANHPGASRMSGSNGKKTNFVEVLDIGDDEHQPITSQYFSEEDHEELG